MISALSASASTLSNAPLWYLTRSTGVIAFAGDDNRSVRGAKRGEGRQQHTRLRVA